MAGLLTNLKILWLKDVDGLPFDVPLLFECMFNPDTYKTTHTVAYTVQQASGGLPTLGFNKTPPMSFSIEFVIDATGVSSDLDLPAVPIPVQVLLFNTVTLDTKGDTHRPNHLIVQWGTFIRQCVLQSSTITYTLPSSNTIFAVAILLNCRATVIVNTPILLLIAVPPIKIFCDRTSVGSWV